jgi:hypothetical protein
MKEDKSAAPTAKLSLVASDDKKPSVSLAAGMKLEVVSVSLVDPQMKKARIGASRLCGGTSTCVALVELEK